jgi:two-component system chemotaxis sensor kinase CheA
VATGKSPTGHVRVAARQQSGHVFIDVADDGRGLDRDRLLAKAVEHGLVAPDATPSDEQIWDTVFHPGLSTAAAVSEVSGRGVGMDVVKRNVEALGGTIVIRTRHGHGTTFRIKLPLTLAILDGQSIRVGAQEYLLPLVAISETVRVPRADVRSLTPGTEVAVVHGRVVPIVRLHRLFAVPPRTTEIHRGLLVLVEHDGTTAGLFVDDLGGQQQVVVKSLDTNFTKVPGIGGATILGDGRVALILDVAGLIALAHTGPAPLRAVA